MNAARPASIRALFFAACATLVVGTASAAPTSQVVRFNDLDVTSTEGATALYARLKRAAQSVCADRNAKDLTRKLQHEACVEQALAEAVRKTNVKALADLDSVGEKAAKS